jgi:hypothetical protein
MDCCNGKSLARLARLRVCASIDCASIDCASIDCASTMRVLRVLSLACALVVRADPTLQAAANFMKAVEERNGHVMERRLIDDHFRPKQSEMREASKVLGKEQVQLVRNFVIEFGPWLGRVEYGTHAPLHDVLKRADELLGLPDDEDQDLHPYRKAATILAAMRKFVDAVVEAGGDFRRVVIPSNEHDEL